MADTVMYRQALAGAATVSGWSVHWYNAKTVLDAARDALRIQDLEACFAELKKSLGPPWDNDHRVALAAAIAGRTPRT